MQQVTWAELRKKGLCIGDILAANTGSRFENKLKAKAEALGCNGDYETLKMHSTLIGGSFYALEDRVRKYCFLPVDCEPLDHKGKVLGWFEGNGPDAEIAYFIFDSLDEARDWYSTNNQ